MHRGYRIVFILWSYLHILGNCFLRTFLHTALTNKKQFLNRSIWAIDGTLIATSTPSQSGPRSNTKDTHI